MLKISSHARVSALMCVAAIALSACANTEIIPVSANQIIISTSAEPMCGGQGALRIANRQAAAETLRRGFDKYMIVASEGMNNVHQIGTTPIYADTEFTSRRVGNSIYSDGTTTFSGGYPIYGGSHDRYLGVNMYKDDDPAGSNALDARDELGPDWKKIISKSQLTCL